MRSVQWPFEAWSLRVGFLSIQLIGLSSLSPTRFIRYGMPRYHGRRLHQLPCDRVPDRRGRWQPASRRAHFHACHQRRAVPRTAACDAGLTVRFFLLIWTTLAIHSTSLLTPLVAALPPGPGSLDFSPACFIPSIMSRCMHAFLPMFCPFLSPTRVCSLACCPVECLGWVFLPSTHYGFLAALDYHCFFHASWLSRLRKIYRLIGGDVTC